MRAAYRSVYGLPEVLGIKDVEIPIPKANEIRVKVFAATVNRSDYHALTGKPLIMRVATGLINPKLSITGSDFAGQVDAVGENVKRFNVGDKVMGFIDMGSQSHAEYLTIAEHLATPAPSNVSYEQIAACLEGAFYAISSIDGIKFQVGQKALVIGGTGAIGSAYVQFLKHFGVEVTAVCRQAHSALVRSTGASRIIDYETEDFTKTNEQYDFVFDAVGKNTFGTCKPLLKKKGIFMSSAPNVFLSLVTPVFGGRREVFTIPKKLMEHLAHIKELVEQRQFVPLIDRHYPLEKIAEAYTYVASGQKIGNVIINIPT